MILAGNFSSVEGLSIIKAWCRHWRLRALSGFTCYKIGFRETWIICMSIAVCGLLCEIFRYQWSLAIFADSLNKLIKLGNPVLRQKRLRPRREFAVSMHTSTFLVCDDVLKSPENINDIYLQHKSVRLYFLFTWMVDQRAFRIVYPNVTYQMIFILRLYSTFWYHVNKSV